jgi:hypothetical protein
MSRLITFVITVLVVMALSDHAVAQQNTHKRQLAGAWILVSVTVDNGSVSIPKAVTACLMADTH